MSRARTRVTAPGTILVPRPGDSRRGRRTNGGQKPCPRRETGDTATAELDDEESMASLLRTLLVTVAAALALAGGAQAKGGRYVLDGGTAAQQAQVKKALDASSFDWNLVPATITIHISRGHTSEAVKGEIWLDADLLNAGTFAWGVVQHEYAHHVDFFLLDDAK